jgi:RNA-binding protein Musashi
MKEPISRRSRGFGFVTFELDADVDQVLKTENSIMGKWVEVKRAEPRDMK